MGSFNDSFCPPFDGHTPRRRFIELPRKNHNLPTIEHQGRAVSNTSMIAPRTCHSESVAPNFIDCGLDCARRFWSAWLTFCEIRAKQVRLTIRFHGKPQRVAYEQKREDLARWSQREYRAAFHNSLLEPSENISIASHRPCFLANRSFALPDSVTPSAHLPIVPVTSTPGIIEESSEPWASRLRRNIKRRRRVTR
jgi:hypothetical protein